MAHTTQAHLGAEAPERQGATGRPTLPTRSGSQTERKGRAGMRLQRIDHVGYAVEDLDAAISYHQRMYAAEVAHTETVASDGVREALLAVGDSYIQLLEPLGPDSPVARFLGRNGGPGVHHVGYGVSDVASTLADLKAKGARVVDDHPRPGSRGCTVAFLHPKGALGVLVELVEDPALAATPEQRVVEALYDTRARGDLDELRTLLADDVVWRKPVGPVSPSGVHVGADAIVDDLHRAAEELTGGTFRLDVRGLSSHGPLVVAHADWSAARHGEHMRGREVGIYRVEHGRVAEASFQLDDPEAASRFFA